MRPLIDHYIKANFLDHRVLLLHPVGYTDDSFAMSQRQWYLSEAQKLESSGYGHYLLRLLADTNIESEFRSAIAQHGVFADAMVRNNVEAWVADVFSDERMDYKKLTSLHRIFLKKSGHDEYSLIKSASDNWRCYFDILSIMYLRGSRDLATVDRLKRWYETTGKEKPCQVCGNSYRLLDIGWFIYMSSSCEEHCCFECPTASPERNTLDRLVPEFVESVGFIPKADASPITKSFTSRLDGVARIQAFRGLASIGTLSHVKEVYGSWFHALAETGVLPDGVQVTRRGIRCLAQDGHACRSLDEQQIDDWLFVHNLEHVCEPPYPKHPILNPGRLRADWKVGDTYIEYFGLFGDETYDKKTAAKIQLAKELDIKLISINPRDLGNLDQALSELL